MLERAAIEVTGMVQGVGFRPFVHALATTLNLRGFVQNRGAHVFIDVEGERDAVQAFVDRLKQGPATARIDRVSCHPLAPEHRQAFVIARSEMRHYRGGSIPPDVATCGECLEELFDPVNRRHRHAFIACTACGPRFTMIASMPFDRARTSMSAFALCEACRLEYSDPSSRRFHAQAIACPNCGPVLAAHHHDAQALASGDEALRRAAATLQGGGVVAIKGLGGFHLACDATSEAAVAALRRRKRREARPFAVMVADADGRRVAARAGRAAEAALTSSIRPIVLLDRDVIDAAGLGLAPAVAPGCPAVGLLLPYTPIHHLLLAELQRPLVMTSGNHSDEPMVCDLAGAQQHLRDVADLFLSHDRRIEMRCDDSVVRVHRGEVSPVRRGRGDAPAPLRLAEHAACGVLAVGGQLKNTFCLAAGSQAYLSPHIGTLDTAATYQALGDAVDRLCALLHLTPELVAHDRHPDYLSTRYALRYPAAERVAVQHHHAHVLSCTAEHGCTEPVIGVAFDGAGLGTDGAVWGGEFLLVDGVTCVRAAHLAYVPQPGGDAAAREPWRMAVAHLSAAGGGDLGVAGAILRERVTPARVDLVRQMLARGVCSPPTSSMGRLFDAVAALTGVRDAAAFEGQAAMELEAIAVDDTAVQYAFEYDTALPVWSIDTAPVIRAIAADAAAGRSPAAIAGAFHRAVATMVSDVAAALARATGIHRVALSGGVFQNMRLSRLTAAALEAAHLDVLQHRRVPCNDGGIALGQAVFAARAARSNHRTEDHIACA